MALQQLRAPGRYGLYEIEMFGLEKWRDTFNPAIFILDDRRFDLTPLVNKLSSEFMIS